MSELTKLQGNLATYKADKALANKLRDMKLTPNWKAVIDEGFFTDLVTDIVTKLASANTAEKEQYLATLTGISAVKQYLTTLTTNGELADIRIKDTEAAIFELLGETA